MDRDRCEHVYMHSNIPTLTCLRSYPRWPRKHQSILASIRRRSFLEQAITALRRAECADFTQVFETRKHLSHNKHSFCSIRINLRLLSVTCRAGLTSLLNFSVFDCCACEREQVLSPKCEKTAVQKKRHARERESEGVFILGRRGAKRTQTACMATGIVMLPPPAVHISGLFRTR